MTISYSKLWALLKENKMKKKELAAAAELSPYMMNKLNHNEPVSMDVMLKLCKIFHCDIGDLVEIIEDLRLDLGEKVVGGLSHNRLLADDAVDNRTRRAATAEALEVIAVCDVLVGLVDGLVDFLSGNDDLGDDLVGLGPLGGDGDLQRSSSVSCAAGAAAPRAVSKL